MAVSVCPLPSHLYVPPPQCALFPGLRLRTLPYDLTLGCGAHAQVAVKASDGASEAKRAEASLPPPLPLFTAAVKAPEARNKPPQTCVVVCALAPAAMVALVAAPADLGRCVFVALVGVVPQWHRRAYDVAVPTTGTRTHAITHALSAQARAPWPRDGDASA